MDDVRRGGRGELPLPGTVTVTVTVDDDDGNDDDGNVVKAQQHKVTCSSLLDSMVLRGIDTAVVVGDGVATIGNLFSSNNKKTNTAIPCDYCGSIAFTMSPRFDSLAEQKVTAILGPWVEGIFLICVESTIL
jgi:hypothetical protein